MSGPPPLSRMQGSVVRVCLGLLAGLALSSAFINNLGQTNGVKSARPFQSGESLWGWMLRNASEWE